MTTQIDGGRELFKIVLGAARELVGDGRLTLPFVVVLTSRNGALLALRFEGAGEYRVVAEHGLPGVMARPVVLTFVDELGRVEVVTIEDRPEGRVEGEARSWN
jgi:hypothetical protein